VNITHKHGQGTHFQQFRVLARVQGLLTQLIFEHSLRIRATSQTAEGDTSTQPNTPDTASLADSSTIAAEQDENATEGDNQNTSTPSAPAPGGKTHSNDKDVKKETNISGKINNLITADVSALEAGQVFLLNCTSSQLKIPA
jgi:hypothetical protein